MSSTFSPDTRFGPGWLCQALAQGEQKNRERAALRMLNDGIDYDDARRVLNEIFSEEGELDRLIGHIRWLLSERQRYAKIHIGFGGKELQDTLEKIRKCGRPDACLCRVCGRFEEFPCQGLCRSVCGAQREE